MKRIGFMILAFALVLGVIVTALPTAKADPGLVKFRIREMPPDGAGIGDDIITGKAAPPPTPPTPNLLVAVVIESPYAWLGQPEGIIGYMVSVRFDPNALTAVDIIAPTDIDDDGFSDGLLEQFVAFVGGSTLQAPAGVDVTSGTMYGWSNALAGVDPAVVGGAGGNPFYGAYGGVPPYYTADEALACVLRFRTKSATIASVFDLMAGPEQWVTGIEVSCKYTTTDGTTYKMDEVDVEDGAYVADTPDAVYLDAMGTFDPANPIGSDWHELWPTFCQEWSLESWDDNGNSVLDESDQVDLTQTSGGLPGTVMWGHVDFLNPTPVAGDGLTDMILFVKEIPEFPLGIGLLMAMVPMIAVAYVWRLRKRSK